MSSILKGSPWGKFVFAAVGRGGLFGAAVRGIANLVVNGDASNGTTGWLTSAGGTIAAVGGRFRVTSTVSNDYAYQNVPTEAGKTYTFTGSTFGGTNNLPRIRVGTGQLGSEYYATDGTAGTFTHTFIATTATTVITLFSQPNVPGGYDEYDDISIVPA